MPNSWADSVGGQLVDCGQDSGPASSVPYGLKIANCDETAVPSSVQLNASPAKAYGLDDDNFDHCLSDSE